MLAFFLSTFLYWTIIVVGFIVVATPSSTFSEASSSSSSSSSSSQQQQHAARVQLSSLISRTSPERTDYNVYDSYAEMSETSRAYFSSSSSSSSSFSLRKREEEEGEEESEDDSSLERFYRHIEREEPIDLRLSISLKLSGFNRDGNFFARVTKRDIEPFLETLRSDVTSEGGMYKMHFHYHVMHAKKELNELIEKTIRENVRVERGWSSTRRAKNVVDFKKVDSIIEKDSVFGGDDDMTKEYKTEKDDVFSPYVIYALNPRRPKNPNDNKANVQYVYSYVSNDGDKKLSSSSSSSSSNSSQCFGTSMVSRDDGSPESSSYSDSLSSPAYAWVDLTSGPNGFTKKRTKFTSDYARRVPPKVLGAHAKQENVPLLSASIAGFLGDASKTLFAPSIRREFLDEHFGSLSDQMAKFKTDDAWV